MSLVIGQEPKGGKSNFPRIEEGTYAARLVQVVDLGLQEMEDFKTKKVKQQHRIWMVFEIPDETIEIDGEERPRWQGKEFTLSYHEKATLPRVIKALDPKGEAKTLADLLGRPCMVNIGSTANDNAKITDIVRLPNKMPVGELQNPAKAFDMDEPDMEVYDSLPDWLKDKITKSLNFHETRLAEMLEGQPGDVPQGGDDDEFDDDIPF